MTSSRWKNEFEQHPFQNSWRALRTAVEKIELPEESPQAVALELARLRKALAYTDAILIRLDPELFARSALNSMQQQADACNGQATNYVSTRNVAHLSSANEHLDSILSVVVPWSGSAVKEAAIEGLREYDRTLSDWNETFPATARRLLAEQKESVDASANSRATIEADRERISAYAVALLEGAPSAPSIQSQIDSALKQATTQSAEIAAFHTSIVVGTTKQESTQARIKSAASEIETLRATSNEEAAAIKDKLADLSAFYTKIFGQKDASGVLSGGLEQEIDTRLDQLNSYNDEQKLKHQTLHTQIESLLPGATSAGLATSYRTLKEGFDNPIKLYTALFYGSLLLLVFGALVMAVEALNVWPPSIKFVETPSWDVIVRALIYKAPFVAPVVWLALFSGKRRSQYERLQQEYAHKEALASSYQSYRQQLDAMKVDVEDLKKDLIAKAIDTIAYNASKTLDGKHDEHPPLQQLLDKLSVDEATKLAEKLAAMLPKRS